MEERFWLEERWKEQVLLLPHKSLPQVAVDETSSIYVYTDTAVDTIVPVAQSGGLFCCCWYLVGRLIVG